MRDFIIGFITGFLAKIAADWFNKKILDRPRLEIETNLYLLDATPGNCRYIIKAVNKSKCPIILDNPPQFVVRSFCIFAEASRTLWMPYDWREALVRLEQHDPYTVRADIIDLVREYVQKMKEVHGENDTVKYSRLKIQTEFYDSTSKTWRSKKTRFSRKQVEILMEAMKSYPGKAQLSADDLGL